jgi:hypothetical protein
VTATDHAGHTASKSVKYWIELYDLEVTITTDNVQWYDSIYLNINGTIFNPYNYWLSYYYRVDWDPAKSSVFWSDYYCMDGFGETLSSFTERVNLWMEGYHSVEVWIIDRFNNTAEYSKEFKIDTNAPSVLQLQLMVGARAMEYTR